MRSQARSATSTAASDKALAPSPTGDRQAVMLRGPVVARIRETSAEWNISQAQLVERAVQLYLSIARRAQQGGRLLVTVPPDHVAAVELDLDSVFPAGVLREK